MLCTIKSPFLFTRQSRVLRPSRPPCNASASPGCRLFVSKPSPICPPVALNFSCVVSVAVQRVRACVVCFVIAHPPSTACITPRAALFACPIFARHPARLGRGALHDAHVPQNAACACIPQPPCTLERLAARRCFAHLHRRRAMPPPKAAPPGAQVCRPCACTPCMPASLCRPVTSLKSKDLGFGRAMEKGGDPHTGAEGRRSG